MKEPFTRNMVLFPRKIHDRYMLFSRSSDSGHTPFGAIYLSESPDLTCWGKHHHVMGKSPCWWESVKIGAGAMSIETDVLELEIKDNTLVLRKKFVHKSFEERLAEYNGEISVCDFDWGEPVGKVFMNDFFQGDIIKITGFRKQLFVIVSKNAFIRATGIFHVRPMFSNVQAGPVHIPVCGEKGESGTVICEQIKAIDPKARGFNRVDLLSYEDIMNVSDAVQGIFEYE